MEEGEVRGSGDVGMISDLSMLGWLKIGETSVTGDLRDEIASFA